MAARRVPAISKRNGGFPERGLMAETDEIRIIIVGGDALALSTAGELCLLPGHRVSVLWPADPEFAASVKSVGAQLCRRPARKSRRSRQGGCPSGGLDPGAVAGRPAQSAVGAESARREPARSKSSCASSIAPSQSRSRKTCSIVRCSRSPGTRRRPTHRPRCDPTCFRALQFPEHEGPLTGFAVRIADSDIAGERVEDAEQILGVRILAIDRDCDSTGDRTIAPGAPARGFRHDRNADQIGAATGGCGQAAASGSAAARRGARGKLAIAANGPLHRRARGKAPWPCFWPLPGISVTRSRLNG